ncbi:hypothetical protein LTR08_008164 [Meristemomyces frigidus]|nr:hypothetical protein LTR08_008164 [Meristemomyces frigidus]
MTRKSERLSSGAKAKPAHKRVASTTMTPSAEAKRSKIATPIRSQYFKGDDSSSDLPDNDLENDSESGADEASDFENSGEKVASSEAEINIDDDDDDDESEGEPKSRKKSKSGNGVASSTTIRTKGGELWRPGVKAGLGPGNQVVIKKPQARKAGKTPYSDETIHPNSMLFLADLKENNDRVWLKMHDADFRASERDWFSFVEKITERLTGIDDTVPELPVKDIIFRIYRDVRFSSDPTPYKPHFSAAWSRTGRKGPYAHYYLQIAPNDETFVGGGLWHPEAAPTAAMRRDIDLNPSRIKTVLMGDRLRQSFLKGVPKQETKVVGAFVASNAGNALKTKPKGYDAGHADLNLLRLRNYTIGTKLTDGEVLGAGGMDRIAGFLSSMKPFITYLNSVIMPDAAESSEENELESEENGSDADAPTPSP